MLLYKQHSVNYLEVPITYGMVHTMKSLVPITFTLNPLRTSYFGTVLRKGKQQTTGIKLGYIQIQDLFSCKRVPSRKEICGERDAGENIAALDIESHGFGRTAAFIAGVLVIFISILTFLGIHTRSVAEVTLAHDAGEAAIPSVDAVHPVFGAASAHHAV